MAEIVKNSKNTSTNSLVIVESPAKIKTISKFLGGNFKIMSTYGHVKDLPEKSLGVEIKDGHIELNYVAIKGKATVISEICKEAKKCDEIFLASDPDREGEIISFHIGEEIKNATKNKIPIFRIVFNEITKTAVVAAIEQKHQIDEKKVAAQQARRILDRWVGYEVSPILWKKIAKGLSAGRVQSVAVLFICKREEEISAFVPEELPLA
jgi:DNA topoisomerase-1